MNTIEKEKLNDQLRKAGWSPSDINNDSFFSPISSSSSSSSNMDVHMSPILLYDRLSTSNTTRIDKKRGKATTPIYNSIDRVSKVSDNRETPISIKPINLAFNSIDLTTSPPSKDMISSNNISSSPSSNNSNNNNNQEVILLDLTTAFSQQSINNNLSTLALQQQSNNENTKPNINIKGKFMSANQILKQNNENIDFSYNKENKCNSNININNNNFKSIISNKHINNSEVNKNKIISHPIYNLKELLLKAAKLDEVLPNGWELYPHQKEAISQCLEMGRK
jgi:hypothetical protein